MIRIGAPRNLGVLLQEFGRAGRKAEKDFYTSMNMLMIRGWVYG